MAEFLKKYSIFFLILAFFALYSALSIGKHLRFETSAADLGIYGQSVWHYSRFEVPFSSIKNLNQLGDHFNPTLALLTPIYWIYPSVTSLLLSQSFLVSLGALPLFWFAREKLGLLFALILSFAYLVFPGIQSGIDFNFHPEVIAATWISFSIYFFFKRKLLLYFIFLVLALFSKEDIAPIFLGLGIYSIFIKKWIKVGLVTSILSLLWFWLSTSILMPYFLGSNIEFFTISSKASNVFSILFSNPVTFFKNLIFPLDKIETVYTLFASFAFFPLFSPLSWLTTPATFINRFFSDDWARWSTHFQYSATIAPLLAISAILGIENLRKFFKKNSFENIKKFLILAIFLGTILANRPGWDPPFITPPTQQIFRRSFWILSENQKQVHEVLKIIPPRASVATNTVYVPHLLNRQKILEFPNVWEEPEIYFLTTFNLYPDETLKKFEEKIDELKKDKKYELVFEKDGILLFRRK